MSNYFDLWSSYWPVHPSHKFGRTFVKDAGTSDRVALVRSLMRVHCAESNWSWGLVRFPILYVLGECSWCSHNGPYGLTGERDMWCEPGMGGSRVRAAALSSALITRFTTSKSWGTDGN